MEKNGLYCGDNLDVLRCYIAGESVDLVYLDPPFDSNANYNVLFAEKSGTKAAAQIKAFEDTWQWDESAAAAFRGVVEQGGSVAQALIAFRAFLGESDMLAYLAMMAPRLVELRRALKPTGSLYLHCDSAASPYLKMLLDAVFRPPSCSTAARRVPPSTIFRRVSRCRSAQLACVARRSRAARSRTSRLSIASWSECGFTDPT